MKHIFVTSVTLLALGAILAHSISLHAQEPQQAPGMACNGTYYDEQLHFSYRYPLHWFVLDEAQRDAIVERGHKPRPQQGLGVEAAHGESKTVTRYRFEAAKDRKVKSGVPSVSIMSVQVSSEAPTAARQFLTALDRETMRSFSWHQSLSLRPVEINEVQFIQERFVAAPNANNQLFKVYIDNYAVALESHIVVFSFVASSEDEVNTFASSLQSFKKDVATPECD